MIAKRLLLLAVVASIVGCDRLSKDIATDALSGAPPQFYFSDVLLLSYHENPGSFFSLGAELPETFRFWIFTIGVGCLLALLTLHALRVRWRGTKFVGFALFIAGGIANWTDRLMDGTVIDFLNVGVGPVRTAHFNVADMAITAGFVMLLFVEFSRGNKQRRSQQQSP